MASNALSDGAASKVLLDLFKNKELRRLVKFGLVGSSGVVVNMAIFALGTAWLFKEMADSPRNMCASTLAVVVSIATNFALNDAWTWRDRREGGSAAWLRRLVMYFVVAGVAGLIQVGVMWTLSIPLGINEHLANFVGIGAGVVINFAVNNVWTFRQKPDSTAATQATPPVRKVHDEPA